MRMHGCNKTVFSRWLRKHYWLFLISFLSFISVSWAAEDFPSVKMPLVSKSLLLDISQAGPNRLVVVGERGHILLSDDHGLSFRQVIAPTQSTLTTLFFLDDKNGWAGGHDTVLLVTKDGGETWEKKFYDPDRGKPVLDICFMDASFGIAIGAYGLYLETRDGGATWEDKYFESLDDPDMGLVHFNAMTRSAEGVLFIAGEAGFLARSTDSGATWESLEKIYPGSYFSALFTQQGTLIVAGLRGNAFRSTDKGDTWEPIITQTLQGLNHCVQDKEGRILISGLGSTLLISNDDGKSFVPVKRSDRISIAAAALPDKETIVIVGDGGVMRITN